MTAYSPLVQGVNVLFASPEGPSGSPGNETQMRHDALKAFPELGLLQGVSPAELYARAKVMSRLKDMADNPEKTFGKMKAALNSVGVGNSVENLRAVLEQLKTVGSITKLGDNQINAWFKGWDGPGDTNVAVVSGTLMSNRRFLTNVLNDAQLVAELFAGSVERAPESAETEAVRQRTRFGTFLLALETRHPSSDYKNMFREAHAALRAGNIDKAKEIVRKTLKDDWNIDVNTLGDAQGHIEALRAIGATEEASLETTRRVKEKAKKSSKELTQKENELITEIGTNIEREKQRSMDNAKRKYQSMLDALPTHDPVRMQYERSKDQMIAQLTEDMAYLTVMDGFIKKNSSDGLGALGEVYDDMRGLYGILNFTDANAKMTKEMAIMLGSFIITGGAGALVRGLAVAGRAIAGADALKAVDVANKAGMVRQNLARAGNAGKAALRMTVSGTARVAEGVSLAGNVASSTRLGTIPVEALKFTTADALLRSVFRSEGERSGFENYFEKFGKNLVMFGAFAGMEKYVSGPVKERILSALASKGIGLNTLSTFTVGTTVLTGGDIAAMWGLGMIEKGEFHFPEWKEVFQALAFRIGMKGVEATLPKLAERFRKENKPEQKPGVKPVKKPNETEISIDSAAHNEQIAKMKVGDDIVVMTGGSNFRLERVDGGYKLVETTSPKLQSEIGTVYEDVAIHADTLIASSRDGLKHFQTSRLALDPIYGSSPRAETPRGGASDTELMIAGIRNEIAAVERGDIHMTPEGVAYRKKQLAELEAKLKTQKPQGYRDTAEISRLEGVQIGLKSQIERLQAKLQKLSEYFTVRRFAGDLSKSAEFMTQAPVGTRMKLDLYDASNGTKGYAVYQKGADGKWNHVESNVSGGGSPAPEVFQPFKDIKNGEYALSPKHKDIRVSSCEFSQSEGMIGKMLRFEHRIGGKNYEMRVVKYKDGSMAMEVKVDGNYQPIRGDEAFIPARGTDARQTYDSYMQHQKDLFQKGDGLHNVTETPESILREITELRGRIGETEGALAAARALPERGTTGQDTGATREGTPKPASKPPVRTPEGAKEAISSESFRKEMDALMKMDDATFQKNFTEVQYRKAKGEAPKRKHEVEMYEAAANVRKHSDQTIIEHADDIIKGNREFLGTRPGTRDKAYVVAENAALRSRLRDIVGTRIGPAIAQAVETAAVTGNPKPLAQALSNERNNRRLWPLLLLLLPLLFCLAKCAGDGNNTSPPPAGEGDAEPTPDQIARYCADCANGPSSTLDFTRRSEVNKSVVLTRARREKLSQDFMDGPTWKNFVIEYEDLKNALKTSKHPLSKTLMKRIEDAIHVPNVENVKDLQKCISMFDEKKLGGGDTATLDHMGAQDGILGPITTAALRKALTACTRDQDAPAPQAPGTTDSTVHTDPMGNGTIPA